LGLLKGLIGGLSFLTIIPVKRVDENILLETANHMYFFPLIGVSIGFLAGGFAWLLLNVFPKTVVGVLTIGFILIFTGFHHTDGLLDFGDGLMAQGTPMEKVRVMKDSKIGTGGVCLTLIVVLTSIFCVSSIPQPIILYGLIVSEVSAKFSMVVLARVGKSAYRGLNTYFIDAMHKRLGDFKVAIALGISVVIAVFLFGVKGLAVVFSGVVVSLVLAGISKRHFNGVTGDVFGAVNEISRMVSLLTVLLVV